MLRGDAKQQQRRLNWLNWPAFVFCPDGQVTDRESKNLRLALWRVPKPSEKGEQGPNYASECCTCFVL